MPRRRGGRNSARDSLDSLIDTIKSAYSSDEETMRKLVAQLEEARGLAGSGKQIPVVAYNIEGPLSDEEIQRIAEEIRNNPNGVNLVNILKTQAKRASPKRKRTNTPSITNKNLREYVEERADEIVEIIQNQPAPNLNEVKNLISGFVGEIKTQYSSIDSRLSGIEEEAGRIEGAFGPTQQGVVQANEKLAEALAKLEQLITGQGGLKQEIIGKISSLEQRYGQNPAAGLSDEDKTYIRQEISNLRDELAQRQGQPYDESTDRACLVNVIKHIFNINEKLGGIDERTYKLKEDLNKLYEQKQQQKAEGAGEGKPQSAGQEAAKKPEAAEPKTEGQKQDEAKPEYKEKPKEQKPEQEKDERPKLEDEQQPIGEKLERKLEPAPSVEVGEQGINAFYKADEKARRLVLGRERLLREAYLRAEQGLVSEDGREVDLSRLKQYDEKRAFENRAVGCVAALCKQLYGDYNDMFVESDLMTSLVGFDRMFVRQMVDELGENLTYDNYDKHVKKASENTKRRILQLPALCLDEPYRKKVVKYTGTQGRINPEALSAGDMYDLLTTFKEYGEIPTRAIKDKPYFIGEVQRQAA